MVASMPMLIWMSPSESNRTIFWLGWASARPIPKAPWPPIEGSPSSTSRLRFVLISTQCLPPRPGTTRGGRRCLWKMVSISLVSIMARYLARCRARGSGPGGSSSPRPSTLVPRVLIEPVILVRDENRHGPLRLLRFFECDRDALGIGAVLDQAIRDVEGDQEALGVSRGGVGVVGVAGGIPC